jgi:hypothetical protein
LVERKRGAVDRRREALPGEECGFGPVAGGVPGRIREAGGRVERRRRRRAHLGERELGAAAVDRRRGASPGLGIGGLGRSRLGFRRGLVRRAAAGGGMETAAGVSAGTQDATPVAPNSFRSVVLAPFCLFFFATTKISFVGPNRAGKRVSSRTFRI